MHTHLGSKLPVGHQIREVPEEYVNEIEFDLELIPNVLKVFNVQVIDSAILRKKNVVLISREDFKELFGEHAPLEIEVPRYLRISDKVYHVMIGSLANGHIGITNFQNEALASSLFSTATFASSLTAQPFDAANALKHPLKTAEIHVSQHTLFVNEGEKVVVSADEIKQKIREKLKSEFLQPNLPFSLQFLWGEVKGGIWKMNPPTSFQDDKFSYGRLVDDTSIKIHSLHSPQVVIVDEIYSDEISLFEFKIELVQRLSSANSDSLPLFLSTDEIKAKILEELTGKVICKGYDFTYSHASGWDVRVRLNRAVQDPEQLIGKQEKIIAEDLADGYVIKKSANIRLITKTEVVLTQGPPLVPEGITFKIVDIPGAAVHPTIDLDKERWVNVDELLRGLQQRNKPFSLNEVFELPLSSGTYCISVSKVSSESCKSTEQAYLQTWALPDANSIRFETEPELEVNLIKDKKALPLNKATFQVKALDKPEEDFFVSAAELQELIKIQGPKHFVHNQSFELRTEGDQRLELKLAEVEFKGGVQFEKYHSAFANIQEDTDITFSSHLHDKAKVVHKVYREEIEKLKFTLTPVRRKGVDNYARTPLVLNLEETLFKIRKEINLHKYILEGFTFQVPFGEGWDIEVKFLNGILKPEHRLGSPENRFLNVTSKKGYVTTSDMPIEFPQRIDDIILAREAPVLAVSLHFKVIAVLESHTQDQDRIIKGNWVNLEELKSYLIKMSKSFSKEEKFVVDLETGKFVLEVENAQVNLQEESSQKTLGGMKFAIAENTVVGLSFENRFILQKVRSGPVALKRIEFIVFPEQAGNDQVSLREDEVVKAIRDTLTFPIIKKHLLSITTDSCHRLRLEVKGMNPMDSCKIAKDELLGQIGPTTEIVLKGKENSALSISSPPKILEAEDPIAYLETLGIGGINKQFKQILRIFYTRSERLSDEVARRGIKPIKGVLLYGPPGTGKTSLAKQIGDMLGCSGERLKMLTGTELFNMWFGKSEEKIRDLFKAARESQEKYGDKSELYVIAIDEIDALLPVRGSSPSNTKDGLVNQFLGEMDGMNTLKNILVIGITNRKEQIDPAALRHGRFGVQIDIGLPDLKGRETIFAIHMKKLHEEGLLDKTVNIKELALMTDKFSGADIEGLVIEATQFSIERLNETGLAKEELRDHPAGKVTMKDFKKAFDLRPKEGSAMDEYIHNTMYK